MKNNKRDNRGCVVSEPCNRALRGRRNAAASEDKRKETKR